MNTPADSFSQYVSLLLRLHEEIVTGGPESDAADSLRDEMDPLWYDLTAGETELAGTIGAALDMWTRRQASRHIPSEPLANSAVPTAAPGRVTDQRGGAAHSLERSTHERTLMSFETQTDQRGFVVNTTGSPHARLRPVPIAAVQLEDEFWAPRIEINRSVTIPAQHRQCEETGRIDNFRRASGRKGGDFQGIYFNDSDVYKWLEAAAFSLAAQPDPVLDSTVDQVIEEIGAAQDANGYLNTYFTFDRKPERWTNLRDMHELYCAGHLMQAAVAHHRATGKASFLQIATRLADHICATFGPQARPGCPGHEEIEMALVELYRETGDEKYLQQAACFISQRGQKPPVIGGSAYHQDNIPVRDSTDVVGHAVRAMYLYCGAADVYLEDGDQALKAALDRLWTNMTERRMYVTGGLGARYEGEAFGRDYELPNDRAYTESCAAIGSIMWNWRMLAITGEARYADLLELTLFNGMLAGLSLDGQSYFYQNPLSDDGHHRRQPWFGCACCPPNLSRMIASLPAYFYTVSDAGAWIHLYGTNRAKLTLPGSGGTLALRQQADYPWSGEIEIRIDEAPAAPTSLFLRIPAWCTAPSCSVNGSPAEGEIRSGSYLEIRRAWKAGDTVQLSLDMRPVLLESSPHVTSNRGQVTLVRGPLVYCLEAADNPGLDLDAVRLAPGGEWQIRRRPELLNGVSVLETEAAAEDLSGWNGALYRPQGETKAQRRSVNLTAIPYYAWANREPGAMRVWIALES